MLRATAEVLATATGGEIVLGQGGHSASGLTIDSREVTAGSVFVALPGDRSDGHDHVVSAVDAGAHLVVISRALDEVGGLREHAELRGVSVLRVTDAQQALSDIASWHRERLHCSVVGITGSTGKTTTKDFLSAVLSTRFRTVSTAGNRNNEIGLPLTVLAAGPQTDVLVVEMGMRGVGQIARLCEIAKPTHGLVTNVGTSHIELLGTRSAIAEAKGELVAAIPPEGLVCINGDDEFSAQLAELAAAPVVYYGLDEPCAVRATAIELDDFSRASFTLESEAGSVRVTLCVPGRHNVYNALAASAVALGLGVELQQVAQGLGDAALSAMRMESFVTASGVIVINDAYNANPSSMAAAVETLDSMRVSGRRIAVLGDMAELGSLEELAHFKLGEQVAVSEIDVLVTVGERALRIAQGARAAGMPTVDLNACADVPAALEVLEELVRPGDAVLVKASRVMGLEGVVEGLVKPRVR